MYAQCRQVSDSLLFFTPRSSQVNFLFAKMDAKRRRQLRFDATSLYSVTDQRSADQVCTCAVAQLNQNARSPCDSSQRARGMMEVRNMVICP